jgi:hypothetical protein
MLTQETLNGAVYLNPRLATRETVLHEFGSLWREVAKVNRPELYAKMRQLVSVGYYLDQIKADPNYANLTPDGQIDEAIDRAIGDKGEKFVMPVRRNAFLKAVNDFFDWVGSKLGLVDTKDLADRQLGELIQSFVVPQMMGENADLGTPEEVQQIVAGLDTSTPTFSFGPAVTQVLGSATKAPAQFKMDAEATLRSTMLAVTKPGQAPMSLWDSKASQRTKADEAIIKAIAKQTGWMLDKPNTLKYIRSNEVFFAPGGVSVHLNQNDFVTTLNDRFIPLWNDTTNRGIVFRGMFKLLKGLPNVETFINYIDDSQRTFATLIKEIMREDNLASATASNRMNTLRDQAERAMAPLAGATITLSRITHDGAGNIITTDLELPSPVVMNLIETASQQNANASIVFSDTNVTSASGVKPVTADQVFTKNPNGSYTTKFNHGAQYYDSKAQTYEHILLPESEFNRLRDRFVNGQSALTGEAEAYQALRNFYSDPTVIRLLKQVFGQLNPDVSWVTNQDYAPTRPTSAEANGRNESRGTVKFGDEYHPGQLRTGSARGYIVGDPLRVMNAYSSTVEDVLANTRVSQNLKNVRDMLVDEYKNGPGQREMLTFIEGRINNFDTYRQEQQNLAIKSPNEAAINRQLQRYTKSIFALKIALPAQQIATAMSIVGQGIIDDKHLRNPSAIATLSKLAFGAYRDVASSATVKTDGSASGLTAGIFGDSIERRYLEYILGIGLPADEQARQQERFAVVIERMLDSRGHYAGPVAFDNIGLNAETLNKGQKLLAQYDQFVNDRLMTSVRRADRAPIIFYVETARLQAAEEGLTGDAALDRVADLATQALYRTYNLSSIGERSVMQLSNGFLTKLFGLYSSQQQRIGNTVLLNLTDWLHAEPDSPESAEAFKRLTSTVSFGVVVNAVWVATATAGGAAIMALLSGDPPRDEEQVKGDVLRGTVRNIVGIYPGMAAAGVDYLINASDDNKYNDEFGSMPALANIATGLDAIIAAGQFIGAEDEKKQQRAADSFIFTATDFAAKSAGFPASVTRIVREQLTTDKDDLKE